MFSLLDLLFPKLCLGCGKWGSYICLRCKNAIRPLPYLKCPVCERPSVDGFTHPRCRTKYAIDGLTSFFPYDGVIKKAIKKIKYRFASDIIEELINNIPVSSFSIIQQLRTMNYQLRTFYLVPIPLHPSRYRFRGFNQAEIIAGYVSKKLNIPVQKDLLLRTKKTKPQVEMQDRKKRLDNMKNVFALKKQMIDIHDLRSKTYDLGIILVDDVFTTGATLRSAADVLKRAGVKYVWGMTIAQ